MRDALTQIGTRRMLLVGTVLLAISMWAPLWVTRMEAPQYKGDEALVVRVRAGHVEGDLQEIQTLNKYIGVRLVTELPELRLTPWVLGAFTLIALSALFLPTRWRHRAAIVLFALMVVALIAGAGLLQYRLYEMGHNRSRAPFARVPDFTPPVLGTKKIANFVVHTGFAWGGWALIGALIAIGCAALTPSSADAASRAARVAHRASSR